MALSMTGYGSASAELEGIHVKSEISCLNKKNLEISHNLPKFCIFMEIPLRNLIQKTLLRGNITLNLNIRINSGDRQIFLNSSMLKSWISSLKTVSGILAGTFPDYSPKMNLSDWIGAPFIWDTAESDKNNPVLEKTILKSVGLALKKVIQMRTTEGQRLGKDILQRLIIIEKLVRNIEKKASAAVEKYRRRIKNQVEKSGEFSKSETDLFNRFISVFSEKTDIAEEITRLKSHIRQFRTFVASSDPAGRSLDFLIQEFTREINTIGSKANDYEISRSVVDIKTVIEQIREQVQNIL